MVVFVSIGPHCAAADFLKTHNLRNSSYPFDYLFSSLQVVKHAIDDEFRIFMDKQYYISGNFGYSCRHTFYEQYLDTPILRKHHIKHCKLEQNYDYKRYHEMFRHLNPAGVPDHYAKYQRRTKRFLDLFNSDEIVVFVYLNDFTDDTDELIEFYNAFKHKNNIYVMGLYDDKYRDDVGKREQCVLYESERIKLYRNYENPFTDFMDFIQQKPKRI